MQKTVIPLLLAAIIIASVVAYMALNRQSGPLSTSGVYSVDSAGKTIATSDTKLTLEIPPDALINQTSITIDSISSGEVANHTVVSAYQFGPEGTYFLLPINVRVAYDPSKLPSGLNERDLKLFMQLPYSTAELANISVDLQNHIVSGKLFHFSRIFLGIFNTPPRSDAAVIVGRWDRTDGDDRYTFFADHRAQTLISGAIYGGTWAPDGSNGFKYVLHWTHSPPGKDPFVDWITVASDGMSYSGVNNYDNSIHCVRVKENQKPRAEITMPTTTQKVEEEVTVHSASTDPDDSTDNLEYLWTVVSPSKEVITVSDPTSETMHFQPKLVGDYIVSLTVDDGQLTDTTTEILPVNPNVKIKALQLFHYNEESQNTLEVMFELTNLGSEPVTVTPYLLFTGTREDGGTFQLGTGEMVELCILQGHYTCTAQTTAKLPMPLEATVKYTITAMRWNAILTVDKQVTYYSSFKWADTLTLNPLGGNNGYLDIVGAR